MEFIDHTGHIFSLPSYSSMPVGYDYEEHPYIFWVNDNGKLSVDNYYVKPIRVIFNNNYTFTDEDTLSIKLSSQVFSLLDSNTIQQKLDNAENLFDYISITPDILKQDLTQDDILLLTDLVDDYGNNYSMATFYVVANSNSENVWTSNILINIKCPYEEIDDYCPITIGGEFVDESEPLVINGKNMGIDLPKDIIRAIYGCSYYNDIADEYIYNKKLKELLLNYMNIKGECGNFASAIDSLNWFGWGNKITISKLLQTDNQFMNQYILDKFDISNDVITSFKYFRNSTYIMLTLAGTRELDENNEIRFDRDFYGEGKPKVENLLNKVTYVDYDEQDIRFYKPYYDFLFNELGLKLSALAYYYKKYFLPIHLAIKRATITHQVFVNDLKMINAENKVILTERPQLLAEPQVEALFPRQNYRMFYAQTHLVDRNYNEFNRYIANPASVSELYWSNCSSISIPIEFNIFSTEKLNAELTENGETIYTYNGKDYTDRAFRFKGEYYTKIDREEQYFNCILIVDKLDRTEFNYEYTLNSIIDYYSAISIICVTANNTTDNYINIRYKHTKDTEWSELYSYDEFKRILKERFYNPVKYNYEGKIDDFEIKIQSKTYLNSILVKGSEYINKCHCDIVDDKHTAIYESKFSFVQKKSDPNTWYKDFLILPKIFGKRYDVNFWLNNEFNIYLNVNGTWFTYNFIVKMPELQIDFGKLYYKYYMDVDDDIINQIGDITLFNQLREVDTENHLIKFNHFMWQPSLVEVNNIDFFDDLLAYYRELYYNIFINDTSDISIENFEGFNNIEGISDVILVTGDGTSVLPMIFDNTLEMNKYGYVPDETADLSIIENSSFTQPIELNDLYYVVTLNNQNFYIHKNVIQEYLINGHRSGIKLDLKYLSNENRNYNNLALYYSEDEIIYTAIYTEDGNDVYDTNYDFSSGSYSTDKNILIKNEDGKNILFNTELASNIDAEILDINDPDSYILCYEDETELSKYTYINLFFTVDNNNCIKFYVKTIFGTNVYLFTYKSIYKNYTKLFSMYNENPNVVNKSKYLNRIHLYHLTDFKGSLIQYNPKNLTGEDLRSYEYDFYTKFFNSDCSSKINILGEEDTYDFYLMHDLEYWYALFISKRCKNNTLNNALNITNEQKLIKKIDYTDNSYYSEDKGYCEINNAIITKVLKDTLLTLDDLYIVYNKVGDNSTYGISGELFTHEQRRYIHDNFIINKIFNKNIGAKVSSKYENMYDELLWNTEYNSELMPEYIGVNWLSSKYAENMSVIDSSTLICPKCGKPLSHNIDGYYCTNTECDGCNELLNYIEDASIVIWNYDNINYKLIYNITDDIYSNKNPNGLFHEATTFTEPKYSYSMNNILYYIYDSSKVKVNYNTTNINELIYNDERKIYQQQYTDKFDTEHMLDYIQGIRPDDIQYSTYITEVEVYPKLKQSSVDINNLYDFYILYNDRVPYSGEWHLECIVTNNNKEDIQEYIHIYGENEEDLWWVINPNYNYLEDVYSYKYNDVEITFVDGKPSIPLYLSDTNQFFVVINEDGVWVRYNVARVFKSTSREYVVCDMNIIENDNYKLYSLDYNTPSFYVQFNEYDGLYHLYNNNDKTFDHKLVYLPNIMNETTLTWYYQINGKEYKYTGNVNYDKDNFYQKVTLETPIEVQLTYIPGTPDNVAYYNNTETYYFRYVKSDNRFLINRMNYESTNGYNHFVKDDIIVATLMNNNNLEFKLNWGSKWTFEPMSLKMSNTAKVNSTTETAIMSIGDSNIKYETGYYNVICKYSIDGNTENFQTKKARILVTK